MEKLSLNGTWEIMEAPLSAGPDEFETYLAKGKDLLGEVPGDVNDSLVKNGSLPEPLVGTNFEKFRWVQERSWWYRKRFAVPAAWEQAAAVELSMDGLDVHADIWLNGRYLGHQASAFYPFVQNVKDKLLPGQENVLLVRLTTGQEHFEKVRDFPLTKYVPTEAFRGYPERGEQERIILRKPAFVWGWDWAPQLATCGITGSVELRAMAKSEIRDVALTTTLSENEAVIKAVIELEHFTYFDSARATIAVSLTDEAGSRFSAEKEDLFVASGLNYYTLELTIPEPKLWWPNGSGSQHLYTVQVEAAVDGLEIKYPAFKYGVRTIQLDNQPGRFRFIVNGQPLFMKGGNWIPADSLYGRITEEKVTRLVQEAAAANFNCLRIWGGGRFELDAFYDACDELGILVWQDFMSACSPLPAHLEWFKREFQKEAEYQIRRLRSRTCLLLFCGNNEVADMSYDSKISTDPGWELYHRLLPRLVQNLASHIPYWPTSPYGGKGGIHDPDEGDDHHWIVMRPEPKFWSSPEYWDSPNLPLFNSEYGYGGPCCLESTKEYFGSDSPDLSSELGRQHTNTFYNIPRVAFSIKEHYCDPEDLSLEEYILFGGLCQGLNLGYSLESLRANQRCMGGLFWMYNDAWGENGWSIIDYYLRRKISFYNVKRCLAPQRLVLRRGGQAFGGREDEVVLIAINEGDKPILGTLQLGYLSYDGKEKAMRTVDFLVPARSCKLLATYPLPDKEQLEVGTVVAIPQGETLFEPVSFRHTQFRNTGIAEAEVRIEEKAVCGNDLKVTVCSQTFAHAVHFLVPGDYRLSDHYFDLLPGEKRTITIYGGAKLGPDLRARSVGCRGKG